MWCPTTTRLGCLVRAVTSCLRDPGEVASRDPRVGRAIATDRAPSLRRDGASSVNCSMEKRPQRRTGPQVPLERGAGEGESPSAGPCRTRGAVDESGCWECSTNRGGGKGMGPAMHLGSECGTAVSRSDRSGGGRIGLGLHRRPEARRIVRSRDTVDAGGEDMTRAIGVPEG
ncbi:hypothetical protein C4D60_Mb01t29790 [Musa balbisiana]|uniref:Uncharacterized protein n=1 Tax=Musa balbisiana TaxID=52838 RepID=A0A4V4H7R5_MUSBA|nr:hypothetical protein C4D60_Mb01t29790 [Musa balbisiana]